MYNMSTPKFCCYSESFSIATSTTNQTASATESATAKGNKGEQTIQIASYLSLESSQKKAIQNLIKNREILEYVDTSSNSVISNLDDIIYYVPNFKYTTSWRGSKVVDNDNKYIFTGSNDSIGSLYLGSEECNNPTKFINISYPNSTQTSPYNTYYNLKTDTYNTVGTTVFDSSSNLGFIYQGKFNEIDLNNPNNFSIIQYKSSKQTFIHDVANSLCVGNSQLENGTTFSFIYDKTDGSFTRVLFPGSLTTTTYGIHYNGKNSYTIVGGFSEKLVVFDNIYNKNGTTNPYGISYVTDYDTSTKTFSNWTPILLNNSSVITHNQGISAYFNNKDIYTLAYSQLINNIDYAYILKIKRETNTFRIIDNRSINDINYGGNNSAASNGVANTIIVGVTSGTNPYNKSSIVPYQALVTNF